MTAFDQAWDLMKAPIDVYAAERGRVREIGDDEMLYSGGDVRDEARYYSTDPDIALHYALFGSAVPYTDHTGIRETGDLPLPPMRRTIPRIATIDPKWYDEEEPGFMLEDPFSPGIGMIDEDIGGESMSHDQVIELLQQYINDERYKGDLPGTTGDLYSPQQRLKHAQDALSRLIAYRNNESLERFNPVPPAYEMENDVFRTADYDDFIEALRYDGNMADMLGDWNDLEDWQREAALEAGYTEEDWE
jgi:hypothetical protein